MGERVAADRSICSFHLIRFSVRRVLQISPQLLLSSFAEDLQRWTMMKTCSSLLSGLFESAFQGSPADTSRVQDLSERLAEC